MRFSLRGMVGVAMAVFAVFLFGCDSSKPAKPKANSSAGSSVNSTQTGHETGGHDDATGREGEDHSRGPQLSKEELALAAAQKICPVSDEELGGDMGPPVKLTVKGETFFICCNHCKEKIDADPDKYLVKLAELRKAKPEEDKPEEEKKPGGN